MRILFVAREYPPETGGGGIGSYLAEIAPALAALGHDVHVLSCDARQAPRDHVDRGAHIHRRGHVRLRGTDRVLKALGLAELSEPLIAGLSAFVEHRRLGIVPDVIEYPDWGAEGWLFAALRPRPLIAHLHTPLQVIRRHHRMPMTERGARAVERLERWSVDRADLATGPSLRLVDELRSLGWLSAGPPVAIVPQPIDWRRWADATPVEQTEPVVMFLGKIAELKAPEVLVEAIRRLRSDLPAKALFVAPFLGRHRAGVPDFEWAAEPLTDLSGCEFVGFVPRDALLAHFSRARVLAMPSRFESYGMVAIEAMAARRPAIVTSSAGVAEFIGEFGGGRVVAPNDPRALAEALRPYLEDPQHAARDGARAFAAVRAHLDPQIIARRRVSLYRALLAGGPIDADAARRGDGAAAGEAPEDEDASATG